MSKSRKGRGVIGGLILDGVGLAGIAFIAGWGLGQNGGWWLAFMVLLWLVVLAIFVHDVRKGVHQSYRRGVHEAADQMLMNMEAPEFIDRAMSGGVSRRIMKGG